MNEAEIKHELIRFVDELDVPQRGRVLTEMAFAVQEPEDATHGDFWKLLMLVRARFRKDVYLVPPTRY